ncbi:hypothetical protein GLOTRDRAFT_95652 [Gloeophyllum trabeum ATCC 11539]|uniref:Uncharacterized protein n=1 Tax=Gloeophyllum trabeum (strain ATCC 11539 / FP-39264 / Madison 617) TaxID=670483 RepID=S7PZB9_GLOTA|nr:uncharacterized protein GLOTRDRAFT_95652 [Gloeophyllum trabeum ATCC 11539]EPQ52828.1 hypothetical protein GLOTRDRAFT_95652 [Gloeophyllum trabeum ATCC 11539]
MDCGVDGKPQERPSKRQKTEDEAAKASSWQQALGAAPMQDISSSPEGETPIIGNETDATPATPQGSHTDDTQQITLPQCPGLSLRDRVKETHGILTGIIPLRRVDYYKACRVMADALIFDCCWEKYYRAVKAAGGWVPEAWIIVGDSPGWVESIVERWKNDDDRQRQEETIYWDWYYDEKPPIYEERKALTDKAMTIWRWIGQNYKRPITAEEYGARFPESMYRTHSVDQARDIEIQIIRPQEDGAASGVRRRRATRQDPAFLTTTLPRDVPTRAQLEEQLRLREIWSARSVAPNVSRGDDDINMCA